MVEVRVDSSALRSFVVRVRAVDGRTLGSGLLAAPGAVLTCAHVVDGVDEVRVEGRGLDPPGDVPATVLLRSGARRRDGGLWPFPDLAVLALRSTGVAHPVAPLDCAVGDGRGVLTDDPVAGWGFPRRERGVEPPGSPATFVVEGVEDDGFLTVKAGQAQHGLSGAPLVCPPTRTVVGLMSATRGASTDLGGYLSPVSALADPAPFTAARGIDAAAVLADLLAANRAAVLEDRSPWLAVLPVPDADRLVEQPWATFVRTARSDPADLLRADFGVVDYLFRDEELERQRREWCESADPLGVLVVRGAGGAGKTRFAIQLCRLMRRRGWLAGWLPGSGDADDVLYAPMPRLLVVDYVEAADPRHLAGLLTTLSAAVTALAPARLVLLTRTRVGGLSDPIDTLAEEANARVRQILAASAETAGATPALTPAQRDELYRVAAAAFARAWRTGPTTARPDLSGAQYQLPLDVLFEALDRTLSGDAGAERQATPPVQRVFAHERRHWAGMLPGVDPVMREWTAAAATTAGARTADEAHAALAAHPSLAADGRAALRERLIRWWADLVPGDQLLNPLRPDRLGEHATGRALAGLGAQADRALDHLLALPSDRQVAATLDLLARAQVTDPELAGLTDRAVARSFVALADRADRAARPDANGRVDRAMADAVLRLLSDARLGALVPAAGSGADGPDRPRDVAVACTTLGDLARASGRVDDARALYETALRVDEALVASAPDDLTLLRDVAIDHLRLADLDQAAGGVEQARAGYERYLADARELVAFDPANLDHRRDVAIAHQRLADLDRAAGRVEQARAGYEQFLAGARELVALDPANPAYRRDVAVAHLRLADLDRDDGRVVQTRAGYEQFLAGARELVALDPTNPDYRRSLEVAQQRLADLDRDDGRVEQARAGYEQFLAGARELVALDPANPAYRWDVALAQQRLADLDRDAGRVKQARAGYERYLAGMRELVALDPANPDYRRDVAFAQQRLAELDRAGRPEPPADPT